MSSKSRKVADALDGLTQAIDASNSDNPSLRDLGWMAPPLTKSDIKWLPDTLATRLRQIPDSYISSTFDPQTYVERIEYVRDNAVPHLWNGNGLESFRAIQALVDWIDTTFSSVELKRFEWEKVDKDDLPKELAKKLRSVKSHVNSLSAEAEELKSKIDAINAAHDAALSLPTDLESLEEARKKVDATLRRVDESRIAAEHLQVNIKEFFDQSEITLSNIKEHSNEAARLVDNTADSYRAATTKGLSEAFQTRADRTARSMWIWVSGLVFALATGGAIGYYRVNLVQGLIDKNVSTGPLTINFLLSLFSIAAPVWFAWIATKQIGQRFRLSEDYAFKASVARAYEGYRREAAKIDESFSARLFASALDRLEEAPLRFVESETFGSPWHEALGIRDRIDRRKNRGREPLPVETKSADTPPPPGNDVGTPVDRDDEEAG